MSNYKLFAFCAEQKVFFVHKISDDQPSFESTCDSYSRNPIFIECTDLPEASMITKNWKFDGQNFFPPNNNTNLCEAKDIGNNYKYALTSDGIVTSWIMFPKDEPDSLMFLENLKKNPVIIDVTNLENPPKKNWTFDGQNFFPPN